MYERKSCRRRRALSLLIRARCLFPPFSLPLFLSVDFSHTCILNQKGSVVVVVVVVMKGKAENEKQVDGERNRKKRRRNRKEGGNLPRSLKLINHPSVSLKHGTKRQLIRCGLLTFKRAFFLID